MIFSKICTDLNIKKDDINLESKEVATTQVSILTKQNVKTCRLLKRLRKN